MQNINNNKKKNKQAKMQHWSDTAISGQGAENKGLVTFSNPAKG